MPSNRLVGLGLVNRSEAVYQNMSHSCTRFRYESRKSRHFLTLRSRNSSFHCNRSKVMQVIENCYSTCPGPWMDDVGMSTRVLIQHKVWTNNYVRFGRWHQIIWKDQERTEIDNNFVEIFFCGLRVVQGLDHNPSVKRKIVLDHGKLNHSLNIYRDKKKCK